MIRFTISFLVVAGLLGVYLLQIGILSSLFSYLLSYLVSD